MPNSSPRADIRADDHKCSLRAVTESIELRDNHAIGRFSEFWLSSAFQPVFSLAHRRPIGHEALMRANLADGKPVSPLEVFAQTRSEIEITRLDRLCRAVHLRNYQAARPDNTWLFLNVNPEVVIHGKTYGAFFAQLLEQNNFPANRVVVEILEQGIRDEASLAEAVDYYRQLGCLVAIDDFGSGHSNFERIWELTPDIVKLDRSVVVRAAASKSVRRLLPNLVSLLHEAGCLVLMEGVETDTEALICMDADVDFVQGFYFGRPVADIAWKPDAVDTITALAARFKHAALDEAQSQHERSAPYLAAFDRAARQLGKCVALETACAELVCMPGVERCYLMDADGLQCGTNFQSPRRAARSDPRFAPLEDISGASWVRRAYFRRAISLPGQVQVSRPYLSLSGVNMCLTLSVALQCKGATRVLCCDIDVETLEFVPCP